MKSNAETRMYTIFADFVSQILLPVFLLAYKQIWKTFISINYSDIVYLVPFTTYCVQYVYMGDCNNKIY
jgi:hypothetical protein